MAENKEFKRSLGLLDATSIVAGSMIGSGIFIVSVFMARDLGSSGYMLLAWLLTGFITIAGALSYGELAGMMPKAGGQYVYIAKAYNPLIAFLYGWTVFSVIQTGVIAAVAVAFAKYTAIFFPDLNTILFEYSDWYTINAGQLLAIGSIILLTYINSKGVDGGKKIQLVFTLAKLIALFALIILGLIIGAKTGLLSANFSNPWQATKTFFDTETQSWISLPLAGWALVGVMGATIINSLFSSDAWNNVTFIAGEIKQPEKNIPRSLILGTVIVTALYILANIAYLALLPLQGSAAGLTAAEQGIQFAANDRVGAAAASMIFGDSALYIMAALIMISTFGCNNGIVMAGARLYYAMAKDKLFFAKAEQLNKNQVPAFGLWIQCVWASALCLSGKYGDLLTYATFASLIFYIFTIAGIFILRKKMPNAERPYKALGYPYLPALYILITSFICIDLLIYDFKNAGIGLGIVLLGIPLYYWQRNKTKA